MPATPRRSSSATGKVFANQNKGKAFITGLSTSFSAMVLSKVKIDANFNYNLGRIVQDGAQAPLDHIAPYFGKIGVMYTSSVINLEAYMLYNGKKSRRDYSASGKELWNYTIKASFHQSEFSDDMKNRFDSFMNYINI